MSKRKSELKKKLRKQKLGFHDKMYESNGKRERQPCNVKPGQCVS